MHDSPPLFPLSSFVHKLVGDLLGFGSQWFNSLVVWPWTGRLLSRFEPPMLYLLDGVEGAKQLPVMGTKSICHLVITQVIYY